MKTWKFDISLGAPEPDELQSVRRWRNDDRTRPMLRTPTVLTEAQQEAFYRDVVSNRSSAHRYWAVRSQRIDFMGLAGLTDIQWENGLAEISLIVRPDYQKRGIGRGAVAAVLDEGFNRMRLATIFGECYECSPALKFWRKVAKEHNADTLVLPRRKYWNGQYYSSFYFSIARPA